MDSTTSASTDGLLAMLKAAKSNEERKGSSEDATDDMLMALKAINLAQDSLPGMTGGAAWPGRDVGIDPGITTPEDVAITEDPNSEEVLPSHRQSRRVTWGDSFWNSDKSPSPNRQSHPIRRAARKGVDSNGSEGEPDAADVPRTFDDQEYMHEGMQGAEEDVNNEDLEGMMQGQAEAIPNQWELNKMDPVRLSQALNCIQYLKDRSWIDISSIDTWLMHVWESTPLPGARYIPSIFIQSSLAVSDPSTHDQEIDRLRGMFGDLPERGTPCPLETLVYVLHYKGNHFCVVVFVPAHQSIYLLGRDIRAEWTDNDSDDWESWNGLQIWNKVRLLMGWPEQPGMVLRTADWRQNGYDCGPIACQVAQDIISKGMKTKSDGEWRRPSIVCSHALRIKMAEHVHQMVREESEKYGLLRERCEVELKRIYGDGLEGMNEAHLALTEELDSAETVAKLHSVVRNLRLAIQNCNGCHATREKGRHLAAAQEHPIPLLKEDLQQAKERHRREVLKSGRTMRGYVAGGDEESDDPSDEDRTASANFRDGQDLNGAENDDGVDAVPRPSEAQKRTGVDWKEARLGRFPRPLKAVELPPRPNLRGLQLPFKPEFDDYEGGPTLEELASVPETHLQFRPSLMYVCRQIMLTPAPFSLFKDYGYRLLPCFAQAFYLGKPIQVKDHLCPVGLDAPPHSAMDYVCQGGTGRGGKRVVVNDSVCVGAKKLLKMADRKGDDSILLTGRTAENKYACVDLLRDEVVPDRLHFSVDIDSLIWITQVLKFQSSVSVYAAPVIRDRAPIWKSNHVQIEVLYPQTEEDQGAIGGRQEWVTFPHSLSTIPHLLIGVQQASSMVEILLFFPRMMHRDPHRHFPVSRIPKAIQDFFWDQVLLPALESVIPSTRAPYLPGDRMHSAFKRGSSKQPATFALDPKQLEKLVKKMKHIVKTQEGLAHFGSFFFVLQVKGCKSVTHAQKGTVEDSMRWAVSRVKESFPGFDWDRMMDRNEGELFCDVGITIHPVGVEPLVGLWRLDCLDASFGAGGYRSGNMHTLNTLSMFGGLQAESLPGRRQQTHIAFRSAYNLAYEVTRPYDNARKLFDEGKVFGRDPEFHEEMQAVQRIYTDIAPGRSYGVRDEFRVGGGALPDIMDCIGGAVTSLLETKPILWIPSKIWFGFISRRLKVLYEAHGKVWTRFPPNYGVVSGLFAFLMQSVIFTPPKVNSYVREALAALRYRQNCDAFGMFFIEMDDPSRPWLIEDLPEIDNADVLKELKLKPRRRRQARHERQEGEEAQVAYPIGEAPTWRQITSSLQADPTVLIGRWRADDESVQAYEECEEGTVESVAAEVFILFTCHVWILLNPKWRTRLERPVKPRTLSEALKSWSVDAVLEEILDTSFKPCHSRSDGGAGRPSPSFSERRKMYFPQDEGMELTKAWKGLGEAPGYIAKYREKRRQQGSEDRRRRLDDCLEELLSLCQCLPDSSRSRSGGWIWRIEKKKIAVITNSRFYQIRRVGRVASKARNDQGQKAPPAHRNARSTAIEMLVNSDVPKAVAEKALQAVRRDKDRRSIKSRNRRKPPQKKVKMIDEEDDNSGEDDNQDDNEDNEEEEEEEDYDADVDNADEDDEDE